eukprot:GHVU01059488.1.p1 GENE.GHVU01059488.1~~GHVU01059488.1.p1  ORF type:complete len:346 (-),score=32.16 GHVU01059488.1:535-1545(-)
MSTAPAAAASLPIPRPDATGGHSGQAYGQTSAAEGGCRGVPMISPVCGSGGGVVTICRHCGLCVCSSCNVLYCESLTDAGSSSVGAIMGGPAYSTGGNIMPGTMADKRAIDIEGRERRRAARERSSAATGFSALNGGDDGGVWGSAGLPATAGGNSGIASDGGQVDRGGVGYSTGVAALPSPCNGGAGMNDTAGGGSSAVSGGGTNAEKGKGLSIDASWLASISMGGPFLKVATCKRCDYVNGELMQRPCSMGLGSGGQELRNGNKGPTTATIAVTFKGTDARNKWDSTPSSHQQAASSAVDRSDVEALLGSTRCCLCGRIDGLLVKRKDYDVFMR